jgi:replicative DNA helicase
MTPFCTVVQGHGNRGEATFEAGQGQLRGIIGPDDFYIEANRWCFKVMENLREKAEWTDQVAVSEELRSMRKLEQSGGRGYLSYLIENTPAAVHVEYCAGIVAKCSHLRKQI